jgi:uncharacterized membrane protein
VRVTANIIAGYGGHRNETGLPMLILFALLIGIIAGLRAMTAPAAVSWAAHFGWLNVGTTWLSFMGHWLTPWIFTVLAVIELISDKRATTPSRTVPMQFGARLVTGALSGATIVVGPSAAWVSGFFIGLIVGAIGAVIGTLGGYRVRKHLVAAAGGNDLPIALMEDVVAVFGALLIVRAFS